MVFFPKKSTTRYRRRLEGDLKGLEKACENEELSADEREAIKNEIRRIVRKLEEVTRPGYQPPPASIVPPAPSREKDGDCPTTISTTRSP